MATFWDTGSNSGVEGNGLDPPYAIGHATWRVIND